MFDNEKIINYDMQGWAIQKMTLREMLENLFDCDIPKDGELLIKGDNPLLDQYPRTLEDDGMGYGTNLKYITSCRYFDDKYDDNKKYINVFIEEELDDIDLWKESKFFPYANVTPIKGRRKDLTILDIKKEDDIIYYKCDKWNPKRSNPVWYKEDEIEYF